MRSAVTSLAIGTLSAALFAACGESEPPLDIEVADAASAEPDAATAATTCDQPTATFGRCLVEGTTEPCTGADGEVSTFAPLIDGDALDVVLGPQGSEMFVLALRTTGIYAGDGGAENPNVSITLRLDDEQVSAYMAKPTFMADDGADTLTAQDLYLVIFRPSEDLVGLTLDAQGRVRDRDGVERCSRATFSAR